MAAPAVPFAASPARQRLQPDDEKTRAAGTTRRCTPWARSSWARNANPYGGAENGSGFTSSVGSNQWYYRTNVNIGYYF
jgi:hypothetical protein